MIMMYNNKKPSQIRFVFTFFPITPLISAKEDLSLTNVLWGYDSGH